MNKLFERLRLQAKIRTIVQEQGPDAWAIIADAIQRELKYDELQRLQQAHQDLCDEHSDLA